MTKLLENLAIASSYFGVGMSTVLVAKAKEWFENRKKRRQSDIYYLTDLNVRIREVMAELRVLYDADRVKLFKFKNGDHYASGESDQKITLTHVIMRSGMSYPDMLQNIPISYLVKTMQGILDLSHVIHTVDDLDQDSYLRHILVNTGVSTMMACRVTTAKGKLVGVLMVSWRAKSKDHPSEQILAYADQIGTMLTR